MSDDHTIRLQSDEQLDTVNEQLRLIRRKSGLTFGTDAYLLAAFVRSQPRERAVDLGSGTGILSLLLCARNKVRSVIAAEIQPAFAELTERNAALNGMADRIRVFAGDVRTLGLRDTDGEVGLVLSNPPYLRAGSGRSNRETEKEIARHEVAGGITDFCAAAGRVLRTGGKFCVVWKPERLRELFSAMAENSSRRRSGFQTTQNLPPVRRTRPAAAQKSVIPPATSCRAISFSVSRLDLPEPARR